MRVLGPVVIEFGDLEGHPFRGNQWTGGQGGGDSDKAASAGMTFPGLAMRDKLNNAMIGDFIGGTVNISVNNVSYYDNLTENQLGDAKSELINELGGRLTQQMQEDDRVQDAANRMLESTYEHVGFGKGIKEVGDEAYQPEGPGKYGDDSLRDKLAEDWGQKTNDDLMNDLRNNLDKYDGMIYYDEHGAFTNSYDGSLQDWARARDDFPGDYALLGERLAQDYVDQWTMSAADSNAGSLAMQEIVAEVFPDARSESFDKLMGSVPENDVWKVGGEMRSTSDIAASIEAGPHGPLLEAFIRQEYDNTQSWFKEQGIKDEITLYRGVTFSGDDAPDQVGKWRNGSLEPIEMNPASSWSVDPQQAAKFTDGGNTGGWLLTSTFPVERILATARTGSGALREGEVIVLNGPTEAKPIYADPYMDIGELVEQGLEI